MSTENNTKKSPNEFEANVKKTNKKLNIIIGIIVALIIIVAVTFAVFFFTDGFKDFKESDDTSTQPQSVTNEANSNDIQEEINIYIDEDEYFDIEFGYYYNSIHHTILNQAIQYENYGTGMGLTYTGFDYTKLPQNQTYPGDDYKLPDGSAPTWKQYFEYAALRSVRELHFLEALAEKDGFKVDNAVLNEAYTSIDELKNMLKDNAQLTGGTAQSFDSWLSETYGENMNESIFKDIIRRQTIAAEYADVLFEKQSELSLKNTTALEAAYAKDPDSYNCVDFRVFEIAPVTEELKDGASQAEKDAAAKKAKEDAKKKADEMFGKITNEESFKKLAAEYATPEQKAVADYTLDETTLLKYVEKETYKSVFGEEAMNWLFSKDRKANDKKIFAGADGVQYIFYMVKTAYRDDATIPVDVRHILYAFDYTAKDIEADKAAQKAAAEATVNAINKSDDKLTMFLSFCEKDSDDEGSKSNGGLIEYLGRGKYVKEFEEWSLDPNRKEGDVGIIETKYGYHVMYFVKKHPAPYWQIKLSQTLAGEAYQKLIDDAIASDAYKVKDPAYVTKISEKLYKDIVETYYQHIVEETTVAVK